MGVPKSSLGVPLTTSEPRTGRELIVTTHDFCDPTTWFTTSARVTDQALTDSGDGLTWTSPHTNWIDMTHGKVWDEDALCADVGHGYAVVIPGKTQRAPFAQSGGDYIVDYAAGTVTFASAQTSVTASYSRMVDSEFHVLPDAGTYINIECAEAQFSSDVEMNDSIVFEIWAYNPYDLPNKVLVKSTTYKKMVNFFDEALAAYPMNPALGGSVRGTQHSSVCLQFRYATARPVAASQGVELRVRLGNHTPFGGEHAVASFYCTVKDEVE